MPRILSTAELFGQQEQPKKKVFSTAELFAETVSPEPVSTKVAEPMVTETMASPEQQDIANEGKNYFENLLEYWTEDIPEEIKGASERTIEREKRISKPTILGEKAVEKTGAKGLTAGVVESVAGTPERVGRIGGYIGGTAGEVPGLLVSLGIKAADRLTSGKVNKIIGAVGEAAAKNKTIQGLIKWWEGLPEAEKANHSAALDMTEMLGWKVGGKAADIIEGTGKKTIKTGTWFMGGDLKIKKSLAKRGYGKRIDIKKQNILDNISKYDLESVTGNFEKMANKADNLALDRVRKADDLLMTIAKSPDAPRGQMVDDIISTAFDYHKKYADIGDKKEVISALNSIIKDAEEEGLSFVTEIKEINKLKQRLKELKLIKAGESKISGQARRTTSISSPEFFSDIYGEAIDDEILKVTKEINLKKASSSQGIEELIEFKRGLNRRGKLFVEGPGESDADNIKRALKKKLYTDAVRKIEEFSPEAGKLNREAKELWDIEAVAGDAFSTITNKDKLISASDKLIGGAAGLGSITAMANQNPELALKTLMAGLLTSATVKGLGQGRGASAFIKTGKSIRSVGKGVKKSRFLPITTTGAISDVTRTTMPLFRDIESE